jgi:alkylation response protein AidB-like acyl-CoA dehydrogenase
MSYLACVKVDTAEADERRRVISAAKIKIADACRHVSQESVQLHGGMGMTEELKVSHTFRRLTMLAQTFGDAEHHLERFASA